MHLYLLCCYCLRVCYCTHAPLDPLLQQLLLGLHMVSAALSAGTPLRKYLFLLLLTSIWCASVPLSHPSGSRCTCWLILVHTIILAYMLQVISSAVPLCHTCSLPLFVPLYLVLPPRKGPEIAQKGLSVLVSRARVFRAKPDRVPGQGAPGDPTPDPKRERAPRPGPRREERDAAEARKTLRAKGRNPREDPKHPKKETRQDIWRKLAPHKKMLRISSKAPPQDHHQDPRTQDPTTTQYGTKRGFHPIPRPSASSPNTSW